MKKILIVLLLVVVLLLIACGSPTATTPTQQPTATQQVTQAPIKSTPVSTRQVVKPTPKPASHDYFWVSTSDTTPRYTVDGNYEIQWLCYRDSSGDDYQMQISVSGQFIFDEICPGSQPGSGGACLVHSAPGTVNVDYITDLPEWQWGFTIFDPPLKGDEPLPNCY